MDTSSKSYSKLVKSGTKIVVKVDENGKSCEKLEMTGYPRNRENRETGKMVNKNSLQGKLREYENFPKLRDNSGNFNLIFFLIC